MKLLKLKSEKPFYGALISIISLTFWFLFIVSQVYAFGSHRNHLQVCSNSTFNVHTEEDLNSAISCFNQAATGKYQINISSDILLTAPIIALDNSNETASLTINGSNFTLDGNNNHRIIDVASGNVSINRTQLRNGKSLETVGCFISDCGSGIRIRRDSVVTFTNGVISGNSTMQGGGGIYNNGLLVIDSSTISDNSHSGSFSLGGGGIYNSGTLSITNSLIVNNSSQSFAGGIYNYFGTLALMNSTVNENSAITDGGGIYNDNGSVIIRESIIFNNLADDGAGVYQNYSGSFQNPSAIVEILDTTIKDHSTPGVGAGISNSGGKMNVMGSTISNNFANGEAGGIFNSGELNLINSTVSGNSSNYGGGISSLGGATLKILNSTLSNNSAVVRGGGLFSLGNLEMRNSIVANSTSGSDCDIGGSPLVDSSNLNSDGSCSEATQSNNIRLGPLQNNGGSTETHALLQNSSAIDMGNPEVCTQPPVNNLDQRGVFRSQGSICDIGAYEAPVLTEFIFLPLVLR